MTFLVWNPAWTTGVDLIDTQHRTLLFAIDNLLLAIHENRQDLFIVETLGFLGGFVGTHFDTEETYMRATRYPGLAAHRVVHEAMRTRFAELAESHRNGTRCVDEDVINFLVSWLDQHIDQEDRRMAQHILGCTQFGHIEEQESAAGVLEAPSRVSRACDAISSLRDK
jgi:hemerythrin